MKLVMRGVAPERVSGVTLFEAGATSMYDNLEAYGADYGWYELDTEADLRAWMNDTGLPGMVIARKKPNSKGASHVAIALPDAVEVAARARLDASGRPRMSFVDMELGNAGMLTTEAGGKNRQLTRRRWWARGWAGTKFYAWPYRPEAQKQALEKMLG